MFRNLGWLTSRSSKGKLTGPPRARLRVESLEDRVVPTTFTSFNGTLTIRQTAPGKVVTVTENPNSSITVTSTDVVVGPTTVFGVLNIVYLDQDTTAGLNEVDFINHGGQALPGYVSVQGQFNGNYPLVVDFGATGSTAADTLTPAFNFNVKGNVLVGNIGPTSSLEVNVFNSSFGSTNIVAGGGGTSVIFERDTVRGSASVNLGTGGDFNDGAFDVAKFMKDSIGGSLSVTGTNGDMMIAEFSTVRGNTSVNFTGNFTDVVDLVEFTELQSLNVTTGNGSDEVVGELVTVFGSTTINTNNAPFAVPEIRLGSKPVSPLVNVSPAQVIFGGDLVELEDFTELQNLSVTTGNGNDEILLAAVEVDGNTTLNTGTGTGTGSGSGSSSIGEELLPRAVGSGSGSGLDSSSVSGSSTGGDIVAISDSTFRGTVNVTFGTFNAGATGRADALFIQSSSGPLKDAGGSTTFYGVVNVNMGVAGTTGSNTLDIADNLGDGTVYFDAGGTLSGGLGAGVHTATYSQSQVSGVLPVFVYFTVFVNP